MKIEKLKKIKIKIKIKNKKQQNRKQKKWGILIRGGPSLVQISDRAEDYEQRKGDRRTGGKKKK